jgi:hypothetical protein
MDAKPATAREKAAAAFFNLITGGLPLAVPGLLSRYLTDYAGWAALHSIAIATLALLQLLFVHWNQGSPGAVLTGLLVRRAHSRRVTLAVTIFRASPYLVIVAAVVARRELGDTPFVQAATSAVYFFAVLFICSSGMYALFGEGRSLLDLLTGTEVIKIHKLRGPFVQN